MAGNMQAVRDVFPTDEALATLTEECFGLIIKERTPLPGTSLLSWDMKVPTVEGMTAVANLILRHFLVNAEGREAHRRAELKRQVQDAVSNLIRDYLPASFILTGYMNAFSITEYWQSVITTIKTCVVICPGLASSFMNLFRFVFIARMLLSLITPVFTSRFRT